MKSLFTLAFALMLSTSMVFAQSNEATIDQVGDDQQATVDQVGSNNAEVLQNGSANSATVTQNGIGNNAEVVQDGYQGASVTGNSILVEQVGADNFVGSLQAGTDGTAEFNQEGNGNLARRDDPNPINGLWDRGVNSESYITQIGDDNLAWVQIRGRQNVVDIDQGTAGDLSFGSNAVVQIKGGNENRATIGQFGDSHEAEIYIDGSMNHTFVTQSGMGHDTTVRQTGSGNSAAVSQSGF